MVLCALRPTIDAAYGFWYNGRAPDGSDRWLVELLLSADMLSEHSKAQHETFEQTALKVSGKVGTGVVAVGAAAIGAAAIAGGGLLVVIAGTGGVALIGVGATFGLYKLLTHRRNAPA